MEANLVHCRVDYKQAGKVNGEMMPGLYLYRSREKTGGSSKCRLVPILADCGLFLKAGAYLRTLSFMNAF